MYKYICQNTHSRLFISDHSDNGINDLQFFKFLKKNLIYTLSSNTRCLRLRGNTSILMLTEKIVAITLEKELSILRNKESAFEHY